MELDQIQYFAAVSQLWKKSLPTVPEKPLSGWSIKLGHNMTEWQLIDVKPAERPK